ncbi:unnamed protein product [Peniophora sp. CBMAI 1063]|nr:unnamed protein product [Peniophora sp. CBMAI 1063]
MPAGHRRWATLPRPSWAKPGDGPVASDDEDDEGVEGGVRIRPPSPLGDIEEIEDGILENPAETLEKLRDLWAERERCGPIDPYMTDFGLAMKGVACMVDDRPFGGAKYDLAWEGLLEAGLGDFCEEVVGQEDFFGEHPYWVEPMLHIIRTTASWCTKRDLEYTSLLGEQLRRTVSLLCRNGQSHYDLFNDANMVLALYAPGNPESSQDMRQHMQSILFGTAHFYLHEDSGSDIRLDAMDAKYFREMCLHLWHFRGDENGWQGDVMLLLALQSLGSASLQDYSHFFDNVVPKVIDPHNFLAGVRDYMEQTKFPYPTYHENLVKGLRGVLSTDPYWPHYHSSGFLTGVKTMINSYIPFADLPQWRVLECALELLVTLTDAAPINDAAGPLIRQIDVIEIISRSSLAFAQAEDVNSDDDVCVKIIKSYTRIAAALGLRPGKNALRKDFRQATRRHWYSTLKTLREMPLRDSKTSRKCAQLVPAWEGLGEALNLEEASEQADYEREVKRVAQLCAWPQCEYHDQKPPNPTRACVGCGEARYCSRACQQKDWKGGHKLKCGNRLKSVPHQPRQE